MLEIINNHIYSSSNLRAEYFNFNDSTEKIIITFNGRNANNNLDLRFGVEYCKKKKLPLVAISCVDNSWFQYDDTIIMFDSIMKFIQRYDTAITYGLSMGAYGAYKFASLYDLSKCILIAPQMSVNPELISFDNRWEKDIKHINKFDALITPSDTTDYYIVYDNTHPQDRLHVKKMSSYMKNLTLIKMPFSSHEVFNFDTSFVGSLVTSIIFGKYNNVKFNNLRRKARLLSSIYFYNISVMFFNRNLTKSESCIQRAIELKMSAGYLLHYSRILVRKKNISLAINVILKAIEVDPKNDQLYRHAANTYYVNKQYDAAKKNILKAISLNPSIVNYKLFIQILLSLGQLTEVKKILYELKNSKFVKTNLDDIDKFNKMIEEFSMNKFEIDNEINELNIGDRINITGKVQGSGNIINIGDADHISNIKIDISGNNNTLIIEKSIAIKHLYIRIGNHQSVNNANLYIKEGFTIENGGRFLLDNHNNILKIGKNCLFSNSITIRCGDSPHLIFDSITGEYLDKSEGVFIGDNVWVGEKVYITKKCSIATDSIVASASVVTRRFLESNIVLAGNPAKKVRENIKWIRNKNFLEEGSIYEKSYKRYIEEISKKNI